MPHPPVAPQGVWGDDQYHLGGDIDYYFDYVEMVEDHARGTRRLTPAETREARRLLRKPVPRFGTKPGYRANGATIAATFAGYIDQPTEEPPPTPPASPTTYPEALTRKRYFT